MRVEYALAVHTAGLWVESLALAPIRPSTTATPTDPKATCSTSQAPSKMLRR
jgi:hypothetical protein